LAWMAIVPEMIEFDFLRQQRLHGAHAGDVDQTRQALARENVSVPLRGTELVAVSVRCATGPLRSARPPWREQQRKQAKSLAADGERVNCRAVHKPNLPRARSCQDRRKPGKLARAPVAAQRFRPRTSHGHGATGRQQGQGVVE
jgi:hypothetical protein